MLGLERGSSLRIHPAIPLALALFLNGLQVGQGEVVLVGNARDEIEFDLRVDLNRPAGVTALVRKANEQVLPVARRGFVKRHRGDLGLHLGNGVDCEYLHRTKGVILDQSFDVLVLERTLNERKVEQQGLPDIGRAGGRVSAKHGLAVLVGALNDEAFASVATIGGVDPDYLWTRGRERREERNIGTVKPLRHIAATSRLPTTPFWPVPSPELQVLVEPVAKESRTVADIEHDHPGHIERSCENGCAIWLWSDVEQHRHPCAPPSFIWLQGILEEALNRLIDRIDATATVLLRALADRIGEAFSVECAG